MKWADAFEPGQVFTLSNLLSLLRVLLLPFFVYFALEYRRAPDAAGLTILMVLTFITGLADFLDGFLARRWGQVTRLGQYLDPVADKTVAIGALALLTYQFDFPLWVFLFYLLREAIGVWGGTFLYFKRDVQGAPNWFGKIGVGLIALTVIWYLWTPYLATRLDPDSIWLRPQYAAYLLVAVLTAGVVQYILTYYKIVFFPDRESDDADA